MKYVFIINDMAGRKNNSFLIQKELVALSEKVSFEYDLYITKQHLDATEFVKQYCSNHPDEHICFVAFGGDGTLLEVAEGLVGAQNKCLALFTCGSGNDFAKYYKGKQFDNLEKLLTGTTTDIDILKVNDRYSINVCNFGFESAVAHYANEIKSKGGKHSYTKGILKAIFTSRNNKVKIVADGEQISRGNILTCSLANCNYLGGKYRCAPFALNDDGLIDVCLFHPLSLIKFAFVIRAYERGEHLTNPKYSKLYTYRRATHVKVSAEDEIKICIDGEIMPGKEFDITILNRAISFVVPAD